MVTVYLIECANTTGKEEFPEVWIWETWTVYTDKERAVTYLKFLIRKYNKKEFSYLQFRITTKFALNIDYTKELNKLIEEES